MTDIARMRWRCRRGIRELDLLLEQFLAESYPSLAPELRATLDALLDEPDLDILAWITNRRDPPRPEYAPLIDRLREISVQPAGAGPEAAA